MSLNCTLQYTVGWWWFSPPCAPYEFQSRHRILNERHRAPGGLKACILTLLPLLGCLQGTWGTAEACLACSAGVIKGTEPGATRTFTKHQQDQMDFVFTEWSCPLERPAELGCPDAPSVFRSHTGALYHQVILAKPLSPTPRFLILSSLQISTSLSSFTGGLLSSFTVKTERMTSLLHWLHQPTAPGLILCLLPTGLGESALPCWWAHPSPSTYSGTVLMQSFPLPLPSSVLPKPAIPLGMPVRPYVTSFTGSGSLLQLVFNAEYLARASLPDVSPLSPPFPLYLFSWTFTLKWLLSCHLGPTSCRSQSLHFSLPLSSISGSWWHPPCWNMCLLCLHDTTWARFSFHLALLPSLISFAVSSSTKSLQVLGSQGSPGLLPCPHSLLM